MKVLDETGDSAKAQRWAPFIVDGKPLQGYGTYAVMPNPADGSVWYTARIFGGGGVLLRFDPKTSLTEIFTVPACRIPWGSTPRDSTGASTIRRPDGRAAGCGARAATARHG